MEFHPLSEIFPLMTGAAFDELVEDIRTNGLREKIWTHEDKIVDGRNRFNACDKAGIRPEFRAWDGKGDLTKFVISLNLHRRHLSESQRAMVAAKLSNAPSGIRADRLRNSAGNGTEFGAVEKEVITTKEAGELLNVGVTSIRDAKVVRRDAVPEVVEAVESGEISVHAAKQIIAEPREKQVEALTAKREGMRREPANGKANGKQVHTRTTKGRKAPEAVRSAIGTLIGLASGLDDFNAADANPTDEEAAQWEKDLASVISSINRFRKQLKELAHV